MNYHDNVRRCEIALILNFPSEESASRRRYLHLNRLSIAASRTAASYSDVMAHTTATFLVDFRSRCFLVILFLLPSPFPTFVLTSRSVFPSSLRGNRRSANIRLGNSIGLDFMSLRVPSPQLAPFSEPRVILVVASNPLRQNCHVAATMRAPTHTTISLGLLSAQPRGRHTEYSSTHRLRSISGWGRRLLFVPAWPTSDVSRGCVRGSAGA